MKEDSYEDEMSLEDLQDYIEAENRRLDAENGFWAKEIVIKIEYKYWYGATHSASPAHRPAALPAELPSGTHLSLFPSRPRAVPTSPSLTRPGSSTLCPVARTQTSRLLCAPSSPSRIPHPSPHPPRRSRPPQARAVEALVRSKMERRDFIILCLEDTSDWNNATTRRLVLQVDPELRRTVLVSTKFDTRIPQFSRAADVELFIKPSKVTLEANPLGGGPFFTSVPSGRVGNSRESLFRSNDQYREARTRIRVLSAGELCLALPSHSLVAVSASSYAFCSQPTPVRLSAR